LLEVGRITRPHGVRGELKVLLHWDGSEALFGVQRVFVQGGERGGQWHDVRAARRANRFVLLRLGGVGSLDDADRLRGASLFVARASLPPLEPGEYYLVDLVGARVEHAGARIGRVVAVRPYATVDALLIEDETGHRYEQPLVDEWVEAVDADAGRIVLASRDGLIE
jgi:16S rRNA processing protein RimM